MDRPAPLTRAGRSSLTILPPRDEFSYDSVQMEGIEPIAEIERNQLNSRTEFVITSLSFCLSLANLSRFPKIAWLYGQGSFVLLYLLLTFLLGSVMFFFEVALGQFSNLGSFRVFSICPLFEGISASMAVYCAVIGVFYNIINVYNMVYLFASLNKNLPYSACRNNTECNEKESNQAKTPEFIYFRDHIVRNGPEGKYSGFIDYVNWRNIGLLLYLWITFTVAIFKGVQKMKRLPFIYVPICYAVFLLVLLVSLCLKGSANGIAFMFIPEWETVKNLKTWIYAFEQTMLTLGLGMGPVITLASYCNFASPAHFDSLFISLFAIIGSLLVGGILFSVMGILAAERHVPINKVIGHFKPTYSGFVVEVIYSQLFSRLPNGVGQIMSFIFFATFLMSGWLSLIMYFETTIFTIFIQIPMSRRAKTRVNIAVVVGCFLLGMFLANECGDELVWKIELHLADFGLCLVIVMEFVAVIYVYGIFRFCDNIERMLEVHTHKYYKAVWIGLPLFLFTFFCFKVHYGYFLRDTLKTRIFAMVLFVVVILPTVIMAIKNLVHFKKDGQLRKLLSPRGPNFSFIPFHRRSTVSRDTRLVRRFSPSLISEDTDTSTH